MTTDLQEVTFIGEYNEPTRSFLLKHGFTPPEKDKTKEKVLGIVFMPPQCKFAIGYHLTNYPPTMVFNSGEWKETEITPIEEPVHTVNAQTIDVHAMSMEDIVIPDGY